MRGPEGERAVLAGARADGRRVREAIDELTDRRIADRDPSTIRNAAAYRTSVLTEVRAEHGSRLVELARERPDLSGEGLAALVADVADLGAAVPRGTSRSGPSPLDGQQRAMMARAEEGTRATKALLAQERPPPEQTAAGLAGARAALTSPVTSDREEPLCS